MSSVVDEVTALCARGYQTGSLVLRGSPAAAGWLLGWLSAEFAPHVLTGHVLLAVPSPLERLARGLAVQRADSVLEDALADTFGGDYPTAVHHPLEHYAARRPNLGGLVAAMRDRRRYSTWRYLLRPGRPQQTRHLASPGSTRRSAGTRPYPGARRCMVDQ